MNLSKIVKIVIFPVVLLSFAQASTMEKEGLQPKKRKEINHPYKFAKVLTGISKKALTDQDRAFLTGLQTPDLLNLAEESIVASESFAGTQSEQSDRDAQLQYHYFNQNVAQANNAVKSNNSNVQENQDTINKYAFRDKDELIEGISSPAILPFDSEDEELLSLKIRSRFDEKPSLLETLNAQELPIFKEAKLKALIEMGVNLNDYFLHGLTPLGYAVYKDKDELVDLLLRKFNVDPSKPIIINGREITPLQLAYECGHTAIAINLKTPRYNKTK